jgi:two-component system, NarL family, invasion response regulator UvrY
MAKVLIVEDHPIFRQGLKEVLTKDTQFAVIGEAADACKAWDHIRKERWDAVVIDINLPGKSGLELLAELKQTHPKLPKLVLSQYPVFCCLQSYKSISPLLLTDSIPVTLRSHN